MTKPKLQSFPKLRLTRKMLAWYKRQEPRLNRMLDAIDSQEDIDNYFLTRDRYENKVREAFFLDTKSINSRENCMRIGIHVLEEWCQKIEKREKL